MTISNRRKTKMNLTQIVTTLLPPSRDRSATNHVTLCLDNETTTDTDNDHDHLQSISINKSTFNPSANNNDLSIYSTSVASGTSIETLKAAEHLSSSPFAPKSSWADLFRSQTAANNDSPTPSHPREPHPSSTSTAKARTAKPHMNGKANATNYQPSKTNYYVYNSNGEESRSLEGETYLWPCSIFIIRFLFFDRLLLELSTASISHGHQTTRIVQHEQLLLCQCGTFFDSSKTMHWFLFRLDAASSSGLSGVFQCHETHPTQRRN